MNEGGDHKMVVARFNTDGTLDTSFDTDGLVQMQRGRRRHRGDQPVDRVPGRRQDPDRRRRRQEVARRTSGAGRSSSAGSCCWPAFFAGRRLGQAPPGLAAAVQRQGSQRLDGEDPGISAGRELRKHLPGGRWAAESGLRSLRQLRSALRPSGLEAAAVTLPPAHRIPVRRPAGPGRAGLGPAQQRRDAARAAAGDHVPGPEVPGLAGGAVPGRHRHRPAPDRQCLHPGHPRRHRRPADHQALHELEVARRTTATAG